MKVFKFLPPYKKDGKTNFPQAANRTGVFLYGGLPYQYFYTFAAQKYTAMATLTKIQKSRLPKSNAQKLNGLKTKKRGNPANLYGILKGKIFYESDEVLFDW